MRRQALVPDSVQDSAAGLTRRAWGLLLAAATRRRGDVDAFAGHDVAAEWLTPHGSGMAVAANALAPELMAEMNALTPVQGRDFSLRGQKLTRLRSAPLNLDDDFSFPRMFRDKIEVLQPCSAIWSKLLHARLNR